MTQPKAVVFDLDGTLLDSMAVAPAAYVETISSLGGPRVTAAEIIATWHIGPAPTVLSHFLGRKISPDDIESYYRHLDQAITDLRAFAGVPDMLGLLGRRQYKLGVYTAATRRAAALMLDAAGLNGFFSVLVGGDEVSQPKPAADGLFLACDRLGVSATEIAYIGDTDLDLLCARNAGALGIQASWSGTGNLTQTSQPCALYPDQVPSLVHCFPAPIHRTSPTGMLTSGRDADMQKIAVVGLGAMGRRIARRLLEAGRTVTVWNRSPGPAAELADGGAAVAGSPADAASRADAVIILVSDPQAVIEVVEGANGVAAGAAAGTVIIQMSTVDPQTIARLSRALPLAVDLLDAPVLGSVAEAEAGSLKIFLGGPGRLIDRTQSVLAALGSPVHVGGLGAGTAAKLVANNVLFCILGVLGESLSLGRSLGLPQGAVFDVLDTTPIAAQAQRRRAAIDSGEYPTRFAMSLARKDARLIAGAARAYGVDLRLAAAALSWFESAVGAGHGDQDYSAVLDHVLRPSMRD